MYRPVIRERAVIRLGGIEAIRKGPTTRGGMMETKSMLCSLEYFQASCSARLFETKYIYKIKMDGVITLFHRITFI
jgi:hypothetical protein